MNSGAVQQKPTLGGYVCDVHNPSKHICPSERLNTHHPAYVITETPPFMHPFTPERTMSAALE